MTTIVEALATIILLVLVVLLITHLLHGDASAWISSKFKAQTA